MNSLVVIVISAVLGSATRIVFGYLGEAEEGEPFVWGKALKSLARGVLGSVVMGLYTFYTGIVRDPIGVFLLAFSGAIAVDVVAKNICDYVKR